MVFDLKDGRRKEPLREQQLANVVAGQLALNRQILAQQLAASIDPQALAAWPRRDGNCPEDSGGSLGGGNRFPRALIAMRGPWATNRRSCTAA